MLPDTVEVAVYPLPDSIRTSFIIPTFLGSEQRNYYGNKAPDNLEIDWSINLGTGKTMVGKEEKLWSGAGWTGQPLMVEEEGEKFIIQGAYDYNLRKINAETGEIIWEYPFDDVIKGTGTLWYDRKQRDEKNKIIIFQGSRQGFTNSLYMKVIPSYRAISYFTGKELWRLNVKKTKSYSRDVDASALVINDTLYIGLENGLFTLLNPRKEEAGIREGILQPKIHGEHLLYTNRDVYLHGGNVVTESSPSRINNHLYIASGSGHIYGYNMIKDTLDWDFYIGSDIDGSPIVTGDSCLLISVEKQYIEGLGGTLKLNPRLPAKEAVVWYKPVPDKKTVSWEGGIIGSVGINDKTKPADWPSMAAMAAIDGYLYVVNTRNTAKDHAGKETKVLGFDNKTMFPTPNEIYKYKIGPSISTPIFVEDKLIAAGYGGLFLFKYNKQGHFELLDQFNAPFESTPIAIDGKIYIASRNGQFYCFGK